MSIWLCTASPCGHCPAAGPDSSHWTILRDGQVSEHDLQTSKGTWYMSNEKLMKAGMQAYIDTFNRADPEGIADLYSDDATVEDPVGSPLKNGMAEIKAFYE